METQLLTISGWNEEAEIINGKIKGGCLEIQFRERTRTQMKSVADTMNFKN